MYKDYTFSKNFALGKRIILLVFILLLAGASLVGYFFLQEEKVAEDPVFDMLPSSSALVIRVTHDHGFADRLLHTNLMWHELVQTRSFSSINDIVLLTDSLLRKNQMLGSAIVGKYVYFTWHRIGPSDASCVGYFPVKGGQEETVKALSSELNCTVEARDYEEHTIHKFNLTDGKLYGTFIGNTMALSDRPILIEDAVRHYRKGSTLGQDKAFKRASGTLGETAEASIVIKYSAFSELMPTILNKHGMSKLAMLKSFAGWTACDLMVKPSTLRFNGFTQTTDTVPQYLSLFHQSGDAGCLEYLPYNTSGFISMHTGDYNTWSMKYQRYLERTKQAEDWDQVADYVKDSIDVDPHGALASWMGSEICVAYVNAGMRDYSEELIGVFEIGDQEALTEYLSKFGFQREGLEELNVKPMRFGQVFGAFMHPAFSQWNLVWYAQMDKYLIVGKNQATINNIRNNLINDRTLAADPDFSVFNENISGNSSLLTFARTSACLTYIHTLLSDSMVSATTRNEEVIRKFDGCILQFTGREKGKFYTNGFINYNQEYQQFTNALWAAQMPNKLVGKPQFVRNHQTNSKDVLVQDEENFIYLISSKGEVMWNRKVDGQIIGEVQQVDAYGNGKLQMLFNTPFASYLIDRKGNDVEKFPIRFPDDQGFYLTAAPSIMDYENNRTYRIILTTRTKQILNYDITGTRVDGWVAENSKELIGQQFQHYTRSGKDYILGIDIGGNVIALSRKGEERLNITSSLPFHSKYINYQIIPGKEIMGFLIAGIDTSGYLCKFTMTGQGTRTELKVDSVNKFLMKDINNDQMPDLLISDEDGVRILDHTGKEIAVMEDAVSSFSSTTYAGGALFGYTTVTGQVFLFKADGTPYEGFPVKGNSAFSIADMNNDESPNLVVNSGNRVLMYTMSKP